MKIQDKAKTIEIHSPKIRLPKHGYTKIELKDPYTCRKQVFESENMLTNAAENYFVNGGFFNRLENSLFTANNTDSIVYHMFGGIMLFDDEIPENANNTGLPNANMTANMAVDVTNNTDPPELGSYSATESGWQQDGSWVQVYNFTTTQGNGDIASACLSSRYLAGIGAGNPSGTRKSLFNPEQYECSQYYRTGLGYFFKIDYEHSWAYAVDASDVYNRDLASGSTIRVYKYLIPLTVIDLKNKWKLLETYTYTIPSGMTGMNRSYYQRNICDGKVIIAGKNTSSSNWDSSNPLQILVIDETGIQFYEFDAPPVEGLAYYYNDGIYVCNGNYYLGKRTSGTSETGFDATTVYKVRLSDNALIKTISVVGGSYNLWQSCGRGEHCQLISDNQFICYTYGGNGSSMLFDFVNDKIQLCNVSPFSNMRLYNSGKIIGADGLLMWSRIYDPQAFGIVRNMYKIMSINNLESTVTKTPDKTMKVTYRITF